MFSLRLGYRWPRPWHLVQIESVTYLPKTSLFPQTFRARPFLPKQGCCGLSWKCLNANSQGGNPKAERWTQQLSHHPLLQKTFQGSAVPDALRRCFWGGGGEQECPQHPVVTERCDRWCTAPQNWVLNSSAVTLCNSAGDILHSPMSLNTKCNPQERACAHGSVLICCLPGDGVWQSWFSCSAAPLLSNKSLHLTSTGSCWSG